MTKIKVDGLGFRTWQKSRWMVWVFGSHHTRRLLTFLFYHYNVQYKHIILSCGRCLFADMHGKGSESIMPDLSFTTIWSVLPLSYWRNCTSHRTRLRRLWVCMAYFTCKCGYSESNTSKCLCSVRQKTFAIYLPLTSSFPRQWSVLLCGTMQCNVVTYFCSAFLLHSEQPRVWRHSRRCWATDLLLLDATASSSSQHCGGCIAHVTPSKKSQRLPVGAPQFTLDLSNNPIKTVELVW